MEETLIEDLVLLFAIISTKMWFSCFVRSISLSQMGTQVKHSLLIGCQCYIMQFGQVGHVCLLTFLKEMQIMIFH